VSTVLIVGVGDMGERLAAGLAAGGVVRRLVLAGRSGPAVGAVAAMVASSSDCRAEAVTTDAARQDEVAELLARSRPDLVVQCAAVRGPWALAGRADAPARAVAAAGLALRLPYQLPVLLSVMRAARDAGYAGPIANLSLPDVTGPVLARLGLAPTAGLGNAAMILLRVRAALRAAQPDTQPDTGATASLPLVRVIGHHSQVAGVMQASEPGDPSARCHVWLGEPGQRADHLAYCAPPLPPGLRYNHVTAAAAIPVLHALLPGSVPLRWSTPAPAGLPGGYPVRITGGQISLDLPPGTSRDDAITFNQQMARADGIERVDDDGTVHFTDACKAAVADLAPDLAAPLPVSDLSQRAEQLDAALA
jgi:hypothetical protein